MKMPDDFSDPAQTHARQGLATKRDLAFQQEEALAELGLSIAPITLADVAAHLTIVTRVLSEMEACEMPEGDRRRLTRKALRALYASLRGLAEGEKIDLDEISVCGTDYGKRCRPDLTTVPGSAD